MVVRATSSLAFKVKAFVRAGPRDEISHEVVPPLARQIRNRALLAAAIIVFSAAAATVSAGLLQLKQLTDALGQHKPLKLGDIITPAASGAPQTILVIGSDKRVRGAVDAKDPPHSDTIMLARLDPHAGATTLMSVPRDLKVTIDPPHRRPTVQKINAAYTFGGVRLAVATIKRVLGININHVVDVHFQGFSEAVNAIGCVYADVDRHYFNDNAGLAPGQGYATINVQPGYQRLCGGKALDYVRFRHTDTDLVRATRQQDFLRQAKAQVGVSGLIDKRAQLERIFGRNTDTDVHSAAQVLRLLKLLLFSLGHPVRQVHFEATLGPSYVTASPGQIHRVVHQFLNGGSAPAERPAHRHARSRTHRPPPPSTVSMRASTGAESASARAASRRVRFPFYFPNRLLQGSGPAQLRVYRIRDEQGKSHRAYRLVIPRGLIGQYYGVEGTNWLNPPILTQPSKVRRIHGREFEFFYDGPRLQVLAWRVPRAVYWISNTLTEDLSERQMLAIAASAKVMRR